MFRATMQSMDNYMGRTYNHITDPRDKPIRRLKPIHYLLYLTLLYLCDHYVLYIIIYFIRRTLQTTTVLRNIIAGATRFRRTGRVCRAEGQTIPAGEGRRRSK
jgi:hypothetical protein